MPTPLPGALLAGQALRGIEGVTLNSWARAASELSIRPFGHDLEALWAAAATERSETTEDTVDLASVGRR